MALESVKENYNNKNVGESWGKVADSVYNSAEDVGRKVAQAAKETVEQAKSAGTQALDEVYRQGAEKAHTLEHYVKSDPLKSVAIAAGVGLAFGLILRR